MFSNLNILYFPDISYFILKHVYCLYSVLYCSVNTVLYFINAANIILKKKIYFTMMCNIFKCLKNIYLHFIYLYKMYNYVITVNIWCVGCHNQVLCSHTKRRLMTPWKMTQCHYLTNSHFHR